MDNNVRFQDFFQRGSERHNQFMRQVRDKADRVRENNLRPEGKTILRNVLSKVANNKFSANTPAADKRLKRKICRHWYSRPERRPDKEPVGGRLFAAIGFGGLFPNLFYPDNFSSIRRRSSSIWVSPGPPRKPAPPRWRSKCVQLRTRRLR